MGRNAKTEYPRNGAIKVRASMEHIVLLGKLQELGPGDPSGADIVSWALEEYARKHFSKQIKFIPDTQPKIKAQRGKAIVIGRNY